MNESQLDNELKKLAERTPGSLPAGFKGAVWNKIREAKAGNSRAHWLSAIFSMLARPQWVAVACGLALLFGWALGRTTGRGGLPKEIRMTTTITGEVVDMACYFDDGARGPDHAACARRCIASGLPVGLKTKDGQTYVLIGNQMPTNNQTGPKHESLNMQLAQYAAKTVTIRGTLVCKEGVNVVENARLVAE
jgi:hypothetical protein